MLLPEAASVKRGDKVQFVFQWGHPFEHELFSAHAPEKLLLIGPDGLREDFLNRLEKSSAPTENGQSVTVYRLTFAPTERGDYTFFLQASPLWMEEEREFLHDVVTVVLHVQSQKGWDQGIGTGLDVVPLTRPYGLLPGMVFAAQARLDGQPLAGSLMEIEQYHPAKPSRLPPEEHITRTARSDTNGSVIATLTEPGWWAITAQRLSGQREHDGKSYPVRQRATFWVYVDGAIRFTPADPAAGSAPALNDRP
jgi:cobalt/nickel transport protein